MGFTPYQQLVRRLEKPLFIAPLLLIGIVLLYDYNTGQDGLGIQYVWLPWILQGLLVLTAFSPFALGEYGNSILPYWLACWIYPVGFGTYLYAWQYLPNRELAYALYMGGWVGVWLLSSYRGRYMGAWARKMRAEHAEQLEQFRNHRINRDKDDRDQPPTPPGIGGN